MTFITKTIYWQQNILMIVKASFPTDFRGKNPPILKKNLPASAKEICANLREIFLKKVNFIHI
jgi:hypothetical protein